MAMLSKEFDDALEPIQASGGGESLLDLLIGA